MKEDDIDLSLTFLDTPSITPQLPDIFQTQNDETVIESFPFDCSTTTGSFLSLLGDGVNIPVEEDACFNSSLPSIPPVSTNYGPFTPLRVTPISSRPQILPTPGSYRMPMMVQTDGRIYELMEKEFEPNPTQDQIKEADTNNLYLRWSLPPPDRVHATSPSRLVTHPRPGTPFECSVQLCAHCPTIGKYIPYPVESDITLSACIYGKRKPKTGAGKSHYNDYYMRRSDYVKLSHNPAGNPLMLRGNSSVIDVTIPKGKSTANFVNLSLTCGSNAARSRKALPAARGWDWDYHLLIRSETEKFCIHSLMSKHLTTDSNRSQTREKRKLSELNEESVEKASPPTKRRKLVVSQTSPESSSSDEDTLPISFRPVRMQTFANVISTMKSEIFTETC